MSLLIQAIQYARDNNKSATIEIAGGVDGLYSDVVVTDVDSTALSIVYGDYVTVIPLEHVCGFTIKRDYDDSAEEVK